MWGETRGLPPRVHLLPSLAPPRVIILNPNVCAQQLPGREEVPRGEQSPILSQQLSVLAVTSHRQPWALVPAFIWIPGPPSENPSAESPAAIGPHLPQLAFPYTQKTGSVLLKNLSSKKLGMTFYSFFTPSSSILCLTLQTIGMFTTLQVTEKGEFSVSFQRG